MGDPLASFYEDEGDFGAPSTRSKDRDSGDSSSLLDIFNALFGGGSHESRDAQSGEINRAIEERKSSKPPTTTPRGKADSKKGDGLNFFERLFGPAKPKKPSYTLSEPKLINKYKFIGNVSDDAEKYTVTVDGVSTVIYAPVSQNKEKGHFHTVAQVAQTFANLPKEMRKYVNSITLNPVMNPDDITTWRKVYRDPDFRSYMTAGIAGNITIYPTASKQSPTRMDAATAHETGHTWSYRKWTRNINNRKWKPWLDAIASDGKHVSNYAKKHPREDVAETASVYIVNKDNPKELNRYRSMVPARFKILERELKL